MKNKETVEEVAEKLVKNHPDFNIEGFSDYHNGRFNGILEGIKWQQEQEQNNENSWFNEYQEVEDYIIKRIGDKFLEATPEKYNTASEATIALLENNWKQEQDENLYSEEIINMLDNVRYWDTCPDKYINIIESFLKQFKKK